MYLGMLVNTIALPGILGLMIAATLLPWNLVDSGWCSQLWRTSRKIFLMEVGSK